MPKLKLTISPDYVRKWGAWEAVRELIQNAIDAHEQGYPMSIEYNPNRKKPTLVIENQGVTLDRSTLLLGTTSKEGTNQRGKFGEGYKLAWLTLIRSGHEVWCRSGQECWIPEIEFAEEFNSNLVTVDVRPLPKFENSFKVEVRGLKQEDWDLIRARFLFPPFVQLQKSDYILVGNDRILTNNKYEGHLYSKGIFVAKMTGNYYFGYDLHNLELDRDRKMADSYSLKTAISKALDKAASADLIDGKSLYDFLSNESWEESRAIIDAGAYYLDNVAAKVTAHFRELYGDDENVIPVSDTAESIEMQHFGFNGIVVPRVIKTLIEIKEGSASKRKKLKALDVKKTYNANELDEAEQKNLLWANNLLLTVEAKASVSVVDFIGEHVDGTFSKSKGSVNVARRILMDKKELLSTVVHEYAHRYGDDGTVEHRAAIESIFSKIVIELTKED